MCASVARPLVDADFVGSKQLSDIRIALRGKAELIFGKNTMIRRCIRNMCEADEKPEWMAIVDVMRGNLGFVFTNGTLADLEEVPVASADELYQCYAVLRQDPRVKIAL